MELKRTIRSESDHEQVWTVHRDGALVGYEIVYATGQTVLTAPDGATEIESFDEVELEPGKTVKRRWFRRGR